MFTQISYITWLLVIMLGWLLQLLFKVLLSITPFHDINYKLITRSPLAKFTLYCLPYSRSILAKKRESFSLSMKPNAMST